MKRDAVGSRCCLGRFGYALARPGTTGRSSLGMRLVLPEVRIDRVIVVGWKEPIVQAVALGDADLFCNPRVQRTRADALGRNGILLECNRKIFGFRRSSSNLSGAFGCAQP